MSAARTLAIRLRPRRAPRQWKQPSWLESWEPPARTVTVATVHGGGGASTLTLLLAQAVTSSAGPALAVDLAGRGRGGLALLAGAAGQTSAEATCALAAVRGDPVARPYGVSAGGVRILGCHADGVEQLDRGYETAVARIVEAAAAAADDGELARAARAALAEERGLRALRWDNGQLTRAVAQVLELAVTRHALVAIDLGLLESDALAAVTAERSDLHVWVLPDRPESLAMAARRLPLAALEPRAGEAICVWATGRGAMPCARRLAALGELRGCPVVRLAQHRDAAGWPARAENCLAGLEELCALAG